MSNGYCGLHGLSTKKSVSLSLFISSINPNVLAVFTKMLFRSGLKDSEVLDSIIKLQPPWVD